MKFKKLMLIIMIVLLTITPSNALNIVANGQQLNSEPLLIKGKTFVPIASIAIATGATVNFDNSSKVITLQKDDAFLYVKIGSNIAMKNGEEIKLDGSARILNGKTYVPLSFIATNLNIPISFNNVTKTVYIGEGTEISATSTYKVTKVIDGDTLEIIFNGETKKVRLIGIDTPESVHPDKEKNVPFGKVTSEFTEKALLGQNVILEFDVSTTDKYGRLLAYVYVGDKMFNKTLLENGMAQVKTYPPDVKYADEFAKIQEQARNNKVGMWSNYENVFNSNIESLKESTNNIATMLIKGNKKSKIYHLPGMKNYDDVSEKNAIYFSTEQEAIDAGYRKAKR